MLQDKFDRRKQNLLRKKIENETLQKQINKGLERIKDMSEDLICGQDALQFLEDVASSRRSAIKSQVEDIVSEALYLIYGDEFRIELVYDVKSNRSSMDIELVRKTPNGDVRRQMDGFGGGGSDVISVPLRLLILLASRQTDKVCILDECYKHVDLERIDRVAEFIKDISVKLGLQIIMCSHHEVMQATADVVWQIQDDNGKSIVRKLEKTK